MGERKIPTFGPETEFIDDDTPVTLPDGTVLDGDAADEYAERVKDNIRRRNLVPGGKSLSGGGKHSPVLQVRLPEETRKRLHELAEEQGVSDSKVARAAIEAYLR